MGHPDRPSRWVRMGSGAKKRIMSEKHESIRISQVLAGALAAVTAAVLGSTMGVAGTVVGAGVASVVSSVGGALYLRSIQRTGQGVRSVRNLVVTRAGATTVTVVEKSEEPEKSEDSADGLEAGEERPPARRIGWRAVVAGSVLAFVLGMAVITGVEWLRGEPLSGGEGTTIGDVVRTQPDGGDEREEAPAPATEESTSPPSTGDTTGVVTPTSSPTSSDQDPSDPSGSDAPQTTTPETATGGEPMDATVVPPSGGAG
jgi:hypothetical protein